MSTENTLQALLNEDLSQIKTGFPVISAGIKHLRIEEIRTEVSKAGKPLLKYVAVTTQPDTSTENLPLDPGYKLFGQISLTSTPKYDHKKSLAEFMLALLGTNVGAFAPIERYIGLEFLALVKVEDSSQYGTRNVIARLIRKG